MRLRELAREIFKERQPPGSVIFRVDAGRVEGLSFGHLSRCMILAKELKRSSCSNVLFLMRDYREGIEYAKSCGFEVSAIKAKSSKREHDKAVMKIISAIMPDCLVADLPDDDPNKYLDFARQRGIFTVCMDDTAKRSFRSDVILNSSILAGGRKYKDSLSTTRFLLGMDYFIMEDCDVKKASGKMGSLSVLITFGGSDMSGLTEKAVSALAESSWNGIDFTVVLGPGFKKKTSIMDISGTIRGKFSIFRSPKNLRRFFVQSDLVICGGGTTLYELYKIGIPCVAIASTAFEGRVIKAFVEKGLVAAGLVRWSKKRFLREFERARSIVRGRGCRR